MIEKLVAQELDLLEQDLLRALNRMDRLTSTLDNNEPLTALQMILASQIQCVRLLKNGNALTEQNTTSDLQTW